MSDLPIHAQSPNFSSVDLSNATSIYVKQTGVNWSWAACNEMLLKAKQIRKSQDYQSFKLFNKIIDTSAGPDFELARVALEGIYANDSGISVRITPIVSYLKDRNRHDPFVIIQQLKNGIPLVMATNNHSNICVGVDYLKKDSICLITKIRLLDPARSSTIVEITMQQFLLMGLIGYMTYDIE